MLRETRNKSVDAHSAAPLRSSATMPRAGASHGLLLAAFVACLAVRKEIGVLADGAEGLVSAIRECAGRHTTNRSFTKNATGIARIAQWCQGGPTRGAQRAPPTGRPPLNEESRCPSSPHCFPRPTSRRGSSRVARSSSSPRWPAPEPSSLPRSLPAPGPSPPPPRALPGQAAAGGTLSIVLNRNLVSLDNKLNQYDAAVTVQRAVREALTKIGDKLTPELVLAESFEQTKPTVWTVKLRDDIHYSDKSKVTVEDVETALKLYFEVKAGYVASQFPEQPTFTKVDDTTFTLTTKSPVVSLNSLMSNILITPAKDNKAEELDTGLGTGPFTVASCRLRHRHLPPGAQRQLLGHAGQARRRSTSATRRRRAPASSRSPRARPTSSTRSPPSPRRPSRRTRTSTSSRRPGTRLIHLFYNFRKPAEQPARQPEGARGAHLRDRPRVAHQGAHERPGHLGRGRRPDDPRRVRQDG